jgi:hypothetical protein
VKESKTSTRQRLADIVREKSKAGQLVAAEELLTRLTPEQASSSEESADRASAEALLREAGAESKDLKEVATREGRTFYYSTMFMSDTYAGILLRKQEGAADLIAGTVREDSDRYPRPTPLGVFKEPPFDLSQEEIHTCLQVLSNREEFQDIRQVSTSIGHVFLYSQRYLDRDYALMLSEWMDVGQLDNP